MNRIGSSLFVAAIAAHATADTTVYTDRLAWEAQATPAVARESFESEAVEVLTTPHQFDSGLRISTSGADVYTAVDYDDSDLNTFHLANTTLFGENYLRFGWGSHDGNYTVSFGLTQDTNAFSFYISGWQPTIAVVNGMGVTLLNDGVVVSDFFLESDVNLDATFFGFADAIAFDEVQLDISALPLGDPIHLRQDVIAFDDVAWAVPSPASLLILGAGPLAMARRRR